MSKFFLFQATENSFLKLVREQSEPLRSDKDEMKDEEDEEDEVEIPKQAIRRNSAAVVNLIHEYEPSLSECKSDTACLQEYTKQNLLLYNVWRWHRIIQKRTENASRFDCSYVWKLNGNTEKYDGYIHWDFQGARKFTEKLDDQFIESLDDITSNIREMYEFGMRETSRSAITRNLRRMWLEENWGRSAIDFFF